jgi:hypothetical protein
MERAKTISEMKTKNDFLINKNLNKKPEASETERAKTISEMETKNDFLIEENINKNPEASEMNKSTAEKLRELREKMNQDINELFELQYGDYSRGDLKADKTIKKYEFLKFWKKYGEQNELKDSFRECNSVSDYYLPNQLSPEYYKIKFYNSHCLQTLHAGIEVYFHHPIQKEWILNEERSCPERRFKIFDYKFDPYIKFLNTKIYVRELRQPTRGLKK